MKVFGALFVVCVGLVLSFSMLASAVDEIDEFEIQGILRRGEVPTPSNSPTISNTPTNTPTPTPTPTISDSTTPSPTISDTPSISFTPTPSPSVTPTISDSPTPSVTPTSSPSITPTISESPTSSVTPTSSPSVTPTISDSPTPSVTPTSSPSITPTISESPTSSVTPTPSPSVTPTISDSPSSSVTPTPSPSVTPTISDSPTSSVTPTPSPSLTPTISESSTSSVTPTSSPSLSGTSSITPSISPSPSPSQSTGASQSGTSSPSLTPSISITSTPGPSVTPSSSLSPSSSFSAIPPASNSAVGSPPVRGCPGPPGLCNLTCIPGAYEYIAVGYNPFVTGSSVLFRWTQQALSNADFFFPDNDPQTFTSAGDGSAPPFFCASANPDPGTPALPAGGDYYLGYANEEHSNQGGVGSVTFNDLDGNGDFRVVVRFEKSTLLTMTQMRNPFTPCDLVVSNWDTVTYKVQKPDGTVVDSGVITCFLLKRCRSSFLYSCQADCLNVPNGPGCISPSASASFLPSGVSTSPSTSPFVFQNSASPSSSSSPSPGSDGSTASGDGASGGDGGGTQGAASAMTSWVDVL